MSLPPDPCSQQRNELIDRGADKVRKLMQKWEDRLTLDNLRLSERYLEGRLEVHIWLARGNPPYYCAVLQHAEAPTGLLPNRADDLGRVPEGGACGEHVSGYPDDNSILRVCRDQQQLVLVDNVQVVERPEVVVPSLVRLGSVNEIYGVRIHSLYSSHRFGCISGRVCIDRERGLHGRRVPVGLHQLPGEVVKGTAEVVDGVTDDQRKNIGELRPDINPLDFLSRLRIVLGPDSIRIGVPEGLNAGFEIADVLFGPFDFRPNAS